LVEIGRDDLHSLHKGHPSVFGEGSLGWAHQKITRL
jgi:hypothetical protein